MALQLVYTSAPRLLQAGRTGFGTVAAHAAIRPALREELERISQFSRVDGIDIRRVIYYHRIIQAGGETVSVISRIRDCGLDYTGRSNHIAHHLVLAAHELPRLRHLSPSDVILAMNSLHFWRDQWTEDTQTFEARDEIDAAGFSTSLILPAQTWLMLTGSAAHAATLAPSPLAESCWIVWPESDAEQQVRLFGEATLLHPNAWQITFSTDVQPTDRVEELAWRGMGRTSPVRTTAAKSVRPTLDLTAPASLPKPTPEFAHLAETGQRASAAKVQSESSNGAQGLLKSGKPARTAQPEAFTAEPEIGSTPPSLLERKKRAQLSSAPPEPASRGKQFLVIGAAALVVISITLLGSLWIGDMRKTSELKAEIERRASSAGFTDANSGITADHLAGLPNATLVEISELFSKLSAKPTETDWAGISADITNQQNRWKEDNRTPEKFNEWLTAYHEQQGMAVGLESQKSALAAEIASGNLDAALELLGDPTSQSGIATPDQTKLLTAWSEFSKADASDADRAIVAVIAALPQDATPELLTALDAAFVRKQQAEFAGLDTKSAGGFWTEENPNPSEIRNQAAKESEPRFPEWAALLTVPNLAAKTIEAVQRDLKAEDLDKITMPKEEFLKPFQAMGLPTEPYAAWFEKVSAEKTAEAEKKEAKEKLESADPLIEWVESSDFVERIEKSKAKFAIIADPKVIEGISEGPKAVEGILMDSEVTPSILRPMGPVDEPKIKEASAILVEVPKEGRKYLLASDKLPTSAPPFRVIDDDLRPTYDSATRTISFPKLLLIRLRALKDAKAPTVKWRISRNENEPVVAEGTLNDSSGDPPKILLKEAVSKLDVQIESASQSVKTASAITVDKIREHAAVLTEKFGLTYPPVTSKDLSDAEKQCLDDATNKAKYSPLGLLGNLRNELDRIAEELKKPGDSATKKDRDEKEKAVSSLSRKISSYTPKDDPSGDKISQLLRDANTHLPDPKIDEKAIAAVKFMRFGYPKFKDQARVANSKAKDLNNLIARRAILDSPINNLTIIVSYGGPDFLTFTF